MAENSWLGPFLQREATKVAQQHAKEMLERQAQYQMMEHQKTLEHQSQLAQMQRDQQAQQFQQQMDFQREKLDFDKLQSINQQINEGNLIPIQVPAESLIPGMVRPSTPLQPGAFTFKGQLYAPTTDEQKFSIKLNREAKIKAQHFKLAEEQLQKGIQEGLFNTGEAPLMHKNLLRAQLGIPPEQEDFREKILNEFKYVYDPKTPPEQKEILKKSISHTVSLLTQMNAASGMGTFRSAELKEKQEDNKVATEAYQKAAQQLGLDKKPISTWTEEDFAKIANAAQIISGLNRASAVKSIPDQKPDNKSTIQGLINLGNSINPNKKVN